MSDTDQQGAAVAILRLLRVYNLDIHDLLWMPLYGRHATNITAQDMQYIAKQARNKGDANLALSWFAAALNLNNLDSETQSQIFADIAKTHSTVRTY